MSTSDTATGVIGFVFVACSVVVLVFVVGREWRPSCIRLDRSGSQAARRRERRYGRWIRALVWPPFCVVVAIGVVLAPLLALVWDALQAVARWVLNPRWEPVLALSLVAGVLWLLSRCGN